ncbi:chitinase domain-containing protein 1 [Condylostylus longicornis]|uniref:chitinase domain-containing protein 1 n=1 Tax=Condylostylus longicornis TaxID=2530218 RepID=UPI00244E3FC1|nr:chitinase domain-containing protein 1 [Condylostylus longicornis]
MKFIICVYLFLISIDFSTPTIAPSKKKAKEKELKIKKGPQDLNVYERNLVEEEPAAKEILVENAAYYKDTGKKNFNGTILGYITPWNNHGYDVAKIWGKKFDIISPVWLQVLRKGENSYILAGVHDVDINWMKDVRKAGKSDYHSLKIYPRVIFDKFGDKDYNRLLSFPSERQAVNKMIVKACHDYKFDGIVLEVWMQLAARVDDDVLYRLIIELADALKIEGYELILVIPPLREQMKDLFSSVHFEKLYNNVQAFSLMTYDFSSLQRPGANAPLHWMRTSIENIVPTSLSNYDVKRKKILLGLNMYGYDYTPDGGGAIIGSQFLDLLKHVKKRLIYDEHDVENFFEVKTQSGRHIVFYPTLHSLHSRIKLAEELGVGLSLWEMGQGLDYFYDLF